MSTAEFEHLDPQKREKVLQALEDYMKLMDSNQPVDRESFLISHSEIRKELESILSGIKRVDDLANVVDGTISAPTEPFNSKERPTKVIRYFGNYELLEEIARGGMGVVYKACQTKLNRIVAVKMILSGNLASDEDIRRFHTEAEAAANLMHPNIVGIHEVGEYENQHYFAMDYIEGQSLSAIVRDTPLEFNHAAKLLKTIAEAMDYAHERKILHRDIKPSNILIDAQGVPHIMDFGLAKRIELDSGMTASGQILGTPSYMPPEQALGQHEKVRQTADIYSLGAVLYEMLSGKPPFKSNSVMDTMHQVVTREPVSIRMFHDKIPVDLETICMKCLEKDPAKRYQTAKELAEELGRFLEKRPILARPVSTLERAIRWCKRNPKITFLLVLVVLSLLSGTAFSSWFAYRENVRAQSERRAKIDAGEKARLAIEKQQEAESESKRAYRTYYASQMQLAANDRVNHDLKLLDSRLQNTLPVNTGSYDFRGFEWYLMRREFQNELLTFTGHDGPIWDFVESADGTKLVSCGEDGTVRIWDSVTGEQLEKFNEKPPVNRVFINADATNIFAMNKFSRQWIGLNPNRSPKRALSKRHPNNISCMALNTKNQWIASGCQNGTIQIWNTNTEELLHTISAHQGRITAFKWIPETNSLLSASTDHEIKLWNVETGSLIRTYTGHQEQVNCIDINPSGERFISAGSDHTIRFWDVASEEEIKSIEGHSNIVHTVKFDPAGRHFLSCSDDLSIRVWDADRFENLATFTGHQGEIHSVAFQTDGKRIVSAGRDLVIKIWDVDQAQLIGNLRGHTGGIRCVRFSHDGRRIISCSRDGTIKSWNSCFTDRWEFDPDKARMVTSIVYDPVSNLFIAAGDDGSIKTWNLKTRTLMDTKQLHQSGITKCIVNPATREFISCSNDRKIKIVRLDDQMFLSELLGHQAPILCMDLNIENQILVTGSKDGMVCIWDYQQKTLKKSLRADEQMVSAIALSPHAEHLLTGHVNGKVKLWNINTGDIIQEIDAHADRISSIMYHQSGDTFATSSWMDIRSKDSMLKLWKTSNLIEMNSFNGHSNDLFGIAMDHDNRRLISTGEDRTIKFWDMETGFELITLPDFRSSITALDYYSEDQLLFAADENGAIRMYDARPWTSATKMEYEAIGLCNYLFDYKHLGKEEVNVWIQKDQTISESVRTQALEMANDR